AEAFEATLLELERAPLGSPAARATLDAVREQWLHLLRGQRLADSAEGRQALAVASDALLGLFDALTADYEHSLQLILS
ncbi:MAG: antitermination regulator, partial [Ideonella sp.]